MTTCTRYPCGGTRHGCPMDDCPGRTALADELIAWVESYAKKVCPDGCLPTPGQEREISMFARITRALQPQPADAPQAEAVAWRYQHANSEDPSVWHMLKDGTDPTKWLASFGGEYNIQPLYAHPQLQQADGRGAVIEALKTARSCIEDLGSGKGGWAWEEMLDQIDAALQQSSVTDNAPAVSSRAQERQGEA